MTHPRATTSLDRAVRGRRHPVGITLIATVALVAGMSSMAAAAPGWAIVASPSPGVSAGSGQASFAHVSCVASNWCEAVGTSAPPSGTGPLVEHWNGAKWVNQQIPGAVGYGSLHGTLSGVACVTKGFCMAVGTIGLGVTFGESWNGTKWTIMTLPDTTNGGAFDWLGGVSCTSVHWCMAVGQYVTGTTTEVARALAEIWNGRSWHVVPTAFYDLGVGNALNDVSCQLKGATSVCTAVGYVSTKSAVLRDLVETWNGAAWALVGSTNPPVPVAQLNSVSCVASGPCEAVGYDQGPNPTDPINTLVVRWSGSAWTVTSAKNVSSKGTGFNGVWCRTAVQCVAVGSYTNTVANRYQTLIESWNGSSWTVVQSPNRSTSLGDDLQSVNCTTNHLCVAVGRYDNSLMTGTLAEIQK